MEMINNYLNFKRSKYSGTYNGVLNLNEKVNEITVDKDGKPSKMNADYEKLLGLKDVYKNKNIEVLNIYGDLKDGTHSDGRVSNSSSRSLKYLLGNSPKTYKESEYKGKRNIVRYIIIKKCQMKS